MAERLEGPFSRRVLVWLVAVAASSLGLGVAFVVVGPEPADVASSGPDAFSRSALGHRAFLDLARGRGIPVLVSRHDSARRAGTGGVLVLAEPRLESDQSPRARRMKSALAAAHTVLLVLPKWTGRDDPARPGWIAEAVPVPLPAVAAVLATAVVPARAARPGGRATETCGGARASATLTAPQLLQPTDPSFRTLIGCDGGVLLGEVVSAKGRRLLVLSDPDILSNHGLGEGDNARLALEVLEHARESWRSVVVDETLHGFERIPSLWRELFAFPLLPAVVQGAMALLLLVWSGLGRFGRPGPGPAGLAPGKGVLIENTALLLRSAGHSAYSLGRYFDATLAEVARALHAPAFARGGETDAWLLEVGRKRGVRTDLAKVARQVARIRRSEKPSPAPIVAAARGIHRWRQEMLRGPQNHPGR